MVSRCYDVHFKVSRSFKEKLSREWKEKRVKPDSIKFKSERDFVESILLIVMAMPDGFFNFWVNMYSDILKNAN